jgi:uncharacterized membrane protein
MGWNLALFLILGVTFFILGVIIFVKVQDTIQQRLGWTVIQSGLAAFFVAAVYGVIANYLLRMMIPN